MTATRDILHGFATLISGVAADLNWTPNAAGGGISMLTMPDTPDRVIVLNLIPQDDNPALPMGDAMIQVAARGARGAALDVYDILNGVFALVHGATNLTWGSVHMVSIERYSSIPMGQDQVIRNEAIDKYLLHLDYPGTAARPATGS